MSDIYQGTTNAPPPDPSIETPQNVVDQIPSAGTSTEYARANHTHQGVAWVKAQGSPSIIIGGVYFQNTASVTWSQAEGYSAGGYPGHCAVVSANAVGATPADDAPPAIAGSSAVGSGTQYAREDHTHRGVSSIDAGGGAIYNGVILSAGSNVTLNQVGQTITIDASGAVSGVSSINTLTGAVTISAGTNITLTQVGNDILISSSGGGGGGRSWQTVTWASSLTLDTTTYDAFDITLNGNTTLQTPTGTTNYKVILLKITQDLTGSRILTLSSGWNVSNDLLGLVISSTASSTSYISAIYNSNTSKWDVIQFARGY